MSRKLIGTVIKQSLSLSITVLNEHEKCSFMNRTHLRGFGARGIIRNESPAPIIWRYQPLCITGIALDTWFDQRDIVLLLHGDPGHILAQLLLDAVVGLQAAIWRSSALALS